MYIYIYIYIIVMYLLYFWILADYILTYAWFNTPELASMP